MIITPAMLGYGASALPFDQGPWATVEADSGSLLNILHGVVHVSGTVFMVIYSQSADVYNTQIYARRVIINPTTNVCTVSSRLSIGQSDLTFKTDACKLSATQVAVGFGKTTDYLQKLRVITCTTSAFTLHGEFNTALYYPEGANLVHMSNNRIGIFYMSNYNTDFVEYTSASNTFTHARTTFMDSSIRGAGTSYGAGYTPSGKIIRTGGDSPVNPVIPARIVDGVLSGSVPLNQPTWGQTGLVSSAGNPVRAMSDNRLCTVTGANTFSTVNQLVIIDVSDTGTASAIVTSVIPSTVGLAGFPSIFVTDSNSGYVVSKETTDSRVADTRLVKFTLSGSSISWGTQYVIRDSIDLGNFSEYTGTSTDYNTIDGYGIISDNWARLASTSSPLVVSAINIS